MYKEKIKWKNSGIWLFINNIFKQKADSWEATYQEQSDNLVLISSGLDISIAVEDIPKKVRIKNKVFWSCLEVEDPLTGDWRKFDCVTKSNIAALQLFCQNKLTEFHKKEADKKRYQDAIGKLSSWLKSVNKFLKDNQKEYFWITKEEIQELDSSHVIIERFMFDKLLNDPDIRLILEDISDPPIKFNSEQGITFQIIAETLNQKFIKSEYERYQEFFNTVEKSPLTKEQADTVICFDNRVLTVAAAGSGKTSTLVAKAGYAIHRKLVKPEEILLLAFNKDAAEEIKARAVERLKLVGDSIDAINIQTFHAFGLNIIGQVTGRKPSIAPWVEQNQSSHHVEKIIDNLCSGNSEFASKWGLLSKVFALDHTVAEDDFDAYENGRQGYFTQNGEIVKSKEERAIADWLFYSGIKYEYECPYEFDTATAQHGQYTPDFYYPDIGVYHEHFALDKDGKAPSNFSGYEQGVEWKRQLHKNKGTVLIETTSASISDGSAFVYLEKELTSRGLKIDYDFNRPVKRRSADVSIFYKLLLTFLSHVKSNMLADIDLLNRQSDTGFTYRTRLFLEIFIEFRKQWQSDLDNGNYFDFDDLLHKAASFCEQGDWVSPYKLIMVDEFQDTSIVRARLVKGMLNKEGLHLFAVGDDWQSINRFAGADISVMTSFEEFFGKGQILKLERTFRCPQSICDISSRFVMKNLKQIDKSVTSKAPEILSPPIEIYQSNVKENISRTIRTYLSDLCEKIVSGEMQVPKGRKLSVLFLGRYRKDKNLIPTLSSDIFQYIKVEFLTVHSSKGLEADIVILPNMISGSYSFPSSIDDDPVLKIAMPSSDSFPFAEERRLFYVALTRAKVGVAMFTVTGRLSSFITEIVKDFKIVVKDFTGAQKKIEICPECKKGQLLIKTGQYGKFLGCSNFVKSNCRFTKKIN